MPLANWLLMIGTVIVTAVYNNVRIILRLTSQFHHSSFAFIANRVL